MCLSSLVGGKFHLRQISSSAGPVGLACFLFASHFFVSSSSEGDDIIAFLGLRRMRGVASGVAVGGGSVTVSEVFYIHLRIKL